MEGNLFSNYRQKSVFIADNWLVLFQIIGKIDY